MECVKESGVVQLKVPTIKVLLVDNQFNEPTKSKTLAIQRLVTALQQIAVEVVHVKTMEDARGVAKSTTWVHCVLLTRTLEEEEKMEFKNSDDINKEQVGLLDLIRDRQPGLPAFLLCDRGKFGKAVSLELMRRISELAWLWEDSVEFIASRIKTRGTSYEKRLLPPLVKATKDYYSKHEYSWTIPGHQAGVGMTKTPSAHALHSFLGSHVFELDLNTSRHELGSLLDHVGPFRESEENIARIFGAKMSFSVVVGGSGANKTIMQACIKDGDHILVDRNCHKSIEHGMILTDARPIYMKPIRNVYGIIGPITEQEMRTKVKDHLIQTKEIPYGVVTNCTFDGICYNAPKVEAILEDLPFLHFDEAWYGHARFNPLYENHYTMRGEPSSHDKKEQTIYACHSTHKMLNAFGQGALIHVRYGEKNPVDFARFNQSYMMHTSTSPSFLIALTNDMAAQMMDGDCGRSLTQEVINEAVDFRQALSRVHREIKTQDSKDWFFKPWNADKFGDKNFEDIEPQELATKQSYWKFTMADKWHGFDELQDDWAMLDPLKVTLISPGLKDDGDIVAAGQTVVPALLLNEWLLNRGIVPMRSTHFTIIFLFTMGITRGKWATLLENLLLFKRIFDLNTPIKVALPQLTDKRYELLGLRDLAEQMGSFLRVNNINKYLIDAYDFYYEPAEISPRKAHNALVNHPLSRQPNVEPVFVNDLLGRYVANAIVPYPPGIPLMIAGEKFGAAHVQFLSSIEKWDNEFPGFELSLMGVERDPVTGKLTVQCLKKVEISPL